MMKKSGLLSKISGAFCGVSNRISCATVIAMISLPLMGLDCGGSIVDDDATFSVDWDPEPSFYRKTWRGDFLDAAERAFNFNYQFIAKNNGGDCHVAQVPFILRDSQGFIPNNPQTRVIGQLDMRIELLTRQGVTEYVLTELRIRSGNKKEYKDTNGTKYHLRETLLNSEDIIFDLQLAATKASTGETTYTNWYSKEDFYYIGSSNTPIKLENLPKKEKIL